MITVTHILKSNKHVGKEYTDINDWITDHGTTETDSLFVESGDLELITPTEVKRTLSYLSEAARVDHRAHVASRRASATTSPTWGHDSTYTKLEKISEVITTD